ncbi:hypothetical protein BBP40_008429 [Aspergillus hancockii]|nr:hypothetical protein BBP40_008429 [Aspergillus hancockii]
MPEFEQQESRLAVPTAVSDAKIAEILDGAGIPALVFSNTAQSYYVDYENDSVSKLKTRIHERNSALNRQQSIEWAVPGPDLTKAYDALHRAGFRIGFCNLTTCMFN